MMNEKYYLDKDYIDLKNKYKESIKYFDALDYSRWLPNIYILDEICIYEAIQEILNEVKRKKLDAVKDCPPNHIILVNNDKEIYYYNMNHI